MRRNILTSVTAIRLATTALSFDVGNLTIGTLQPWRAKNATEITLPKIGIMHVSQNALLSTVNWNPAAAGMHQSGAVGLQPGMVALGQGRAGPTTTPTTVVLSSPEAHISQVQLKSGLQDSTMALQSGSPTTVALSSPEAHASQVHLKGGLQGPTIGLQPGFAALGQATTTTPTATSENNILMSGFVFSGTSYPALTMSREQHVSQTVLPQTNEQHISQAVVETPNPSNAQAPITTPIQNPQLAVTTPPVNTTPATDSILISAFTFQGTAYPAAPIQETSSIEETSAASLFQNEPVLTTPIGNPNPNPASTTTTPQPTTDTTEQQLGISISGITLPTTLGNDAGPTSPILSEAAAAATTSVVPVEQNPSGVPFVPQSFLTSSRPYALTTDTNGIVTSVGVWGNGTGTGAAWYTGGNGTGVPFLGGAGRCRGRWGWGWVVVVGLGVLR